MQIKALYLHNNQLTTLKGSIKCLRHIRTLTLYNNRLQDLSTTLPMMEHLHHLDTLGMSQFAFADSCRLFGSLLVQLKPPTPRDPVVNHSNLRFNLLIDRMNPTLTCACGADMSGNPIANEFNYRLRVIHTFPTLQVLDRHQVSSVSLSFCYAASGPDVTYDRIRLRGRSESMRKRSLKVRG